MKVSIILLLFIFTIFADETGFTIDLSLGTWSEDFNADVGDSMKWIYFTGHATILWQSSGGLNGGGWITYGSVKNWAADTIGDILGAVIMAIIIIL